MAPGPQEGLLGDVLGQGGIAHHAQRQAENAPLVAADKGHAGAFVADAHAGQEGLVGRTGLTDAFSAHVRGTWRRPEWIVGAAAAPAAGRDNGRPHEATKGATP